MNIRKHIVLGSLLLAGLAIASCSKDDEAVKDQGVKVAYDSHAVDLGLPSGLKWSDQNLGADLRLLHQRAADEDAGDSLQPLGN